MNWATYQTRCAPKYYTTAYLAAYRVRCGGALADAHSFDEWTRMRAGLSHAMQWRLNNLDTLILRSRS